MRLEVSLRDGGCHYEIESVITRLRVSLRDKESVIMRWRVSLRDGECHYEMESVITR
jgi:hypothetical protein